MCITEKEDGKSSECETKQNTLENLYFIFSYRNINYFCQFIKTTNYINN